MKQTDADRLGFDIITGEPQASCNFEAGHSPEKRISEEAKQVALLYKGVEVHIKNIAITREGCLAGQVSEFGQICSTQYEGVKLGQVLSFRYPHIHHRI